MNALTKIENTALSAMSEQELISVLQASLYPGAKLESIKMVIGYCKASGLDPMQKPVHIVPMKVSTGEKDDKGWDIKAMRDVIMPGIGLYRTQAARTGEYAGVSDPEFGPPRTLSFQREVWEDGANGRRQKRLVEDTIEYPEWCRVSVTRLIGDKPCEFPAREYWLENYATKGADSIEPNAMWKKRPFGQIAKCAEAQALRKAFPEQTGSQPTADEMEGKSLEDHAETRHMGPADVVASLPAGAAALPEFTQEHLQQRAAKIAEFYTKGKTADEVIAFYSLKSHLPDAIKQAIRDLAPKTNNVSDAQPKVTYAEVADKLNAAKDADSLALAGDLIKAVADEKQRAELVAIYERREAELA